jgi:exodeoxyribonuclease VII large subunit
LFDAERKRALPFFPQQIGIVTSPQAAALRDVLRTLDNRLRGVRIILYPTPVQGEGSAQKIAAAIRLANQRAECEVLIVCRGGGSIEDLWAFNEEVVARAIAASEIPVVSGVGHETDFTIADFVADLRAATPTAAAQAALPDGAELRQRLGHLAQRLARASLRHFEQQLQRWDYLQRRLVHPAQRIQQQTLRLADCQRRLQTAQAYSLQGQQWQLAGLGQRFNLARPDLSPLHARQQETGRRLREVMARVLERRRERLLSSQQHLQHLDPTQVLARGYSLVRDAAGKIVANSAQLALGERVQISFAHGHVEAAVTAKSVD